jgi:threonine-phosphate decarboxylase
MIQGHGGDIYAAARRLGCRPEDIVDMSSNINPLGMPPGLGAYLRDRLDAVGVLPEADGRSAAKHMAGILGVDDRRVLAGNGTTHFIYTVCPALAARKVLIVGPTYADYADACSMHGIQPQYFLTREAKRFDVRLDLLDQAVHGMDTAFICNPNNPTGRLIPRDGLMQLCRENPGTRFIIDESYLPFVPDGPSLSMCGSELENVSVLWSISKIFGLPGIRAGFLIAAEATVARFQRLMQPWSLNSLAQAAVAFLGDHREIVAEFINRTCAFLQHERRRFGEELTGEACLDIFGSRTSYLLMALPAGWIAGDVCRAMAQKRILIRDCGNFHGLSDRFVRVALKDPRTNRTAAQHLAALFAAAGNG